MKGREECKMLGEGVTSLSGSSPDNGPAILIQYGNAFYS
jgi:hypothetical protein